MFEEVDASPGALQRWCESLRYPVREENLEKLQDAPLTRIATAWQQHGSAISIFTLAGVTKTSPEELHNYLADSEHSERLCLSFCWDVGLPVYSAEIYRQRPSSVYPDRHSLDILARLRDIPWEQWCNRKFRKPNRRGVITREEWMALRYAYTLRPEPPKVRYHYHPAVMREVRERLRGV